MEDSGFIAIVALSGFALGVTAIVFYFMTVARIGEIRDLLKSINKMMRNKENNQ